MCSYEFSCISFIWIVREKQYCNKSFRQWQNEILDFFNEHSLSWPWRVFFTFFLGRKGNKISSNYIFSFPTLFTIFLDLTLLGNGHTQWKVIQMFVQKDTLNLKGALNYLFSLFWHFAFSEYKNILRDETTSKKNKTSGINKQKNDNEKLFCVFFQKTSLWFENMSLNVVSNYFEYENAVTVMMWGVDIWWFFNAFDSFQ